MQTQDSKLQMKQQWSSVKRKNNIGNLMRRE